MKDLSVKAKLYIIPMILVGGVLTIWHLFNIDWHNLWLLVLAGLAAIAQVLKVEGSTNKSSYNISWLLYGFTLVLYGPAETMFVILVGHVVEWVWHKYPWYIQTFNIASYAIAISTAGLVIQLINPVEINNTLLRIIGILTALALITFLNHLAIGMVIWLARGQSIKQSGVFDFLPLMIDFTLLVLGSASGLLWSIHPLAALLTIIPLYLIYSTLKVPALERQTTIDPKTKLYNAKYFGNMLAKELERADRYDRPVSVILGDLDLLRNINNSYGHLAGDVVLCGMAEILREEFRDYDVVARFGGEEFAILLPETSPEQAFPRVEKMREIIESSGFEVSTSVTPIKVTMSFGIAGRNGYGQSPNDIIHNADVALYSAKLNGRNGTRIYSDEGVDSLFETRQDESSPEQQPHESRFDANDITYQPNPLREQPKDKPAEHKSPPPRAHPVPDWNMNAYIGVVAVVSVVLFSITFKWNSELDWFGLVTFALLVIVTEGMSVDIYTKDTSISTSAAPFIAGVFLFGPLGALVLSLVLAGTAKIKHRSKMKNFIFNTSNHLISSSLCVGLILIFREPILTQPTLVQFSVLIIFGAILFLSSTMLLSGVMGLSMGKPILPLWSEQFRWLGQYYIAFGVLAYALVMGYYLGGLLGLITIIVPLFILRFSQIQYIKNTKKTVKQLRKTNAELETKSKEIHGLNEELLLALATIIDLRDPYVYGHSENVSRYASLIAKELGLHPTQIERIRKTGLLHDIGKLGIPEYILHKRDKLSAEEYEIVKQHSTLGAGMVDKIHSLIPLVSTIRHHHERYDGTGYPDGLKGNDIPLESRIICLADTIDAMASDRPYRTARSPKEILNEITQNAGTQFDPLMVQAFLNIVAKHGEDLIENSSLNVVRREPIFKHALLTEME